jgi:cytochrome c oxidase subunit 2
VAPTTTTTAPPVTTTTSIDYVAWGAELAGDLGCQNCHSTNGSAALGPTWAGLAGSTVPLADGSSVTATAGYIEESIRFPDAKIVEGFSPGLMQSGYNSLSDGEIAALVAFVSSH